MSHDDQEDRDRQMDLEEARHDREEEAQAERRLHLWKNVAIWGGVVLALSVASVVPFLYGHSLHSHWDSMGKYLVMLSMVLVWVFPLAVLIAFFSWRELRDLRKIDREYPPPGNNGPGGE